MPTTNRATTVQSALNDGNVNVFGAAAQLLKLGNVLSPIKVVVTGLTASATVNITAAATKAAATITGFTPALATGQNLPAIGSIDTLRVTTVGTGATGVRAVTDAGGTASSSVALISDDGTTLTFEGTVTGFVMWYWPRPENLATTLQTAP